MYEEERHQELIDGVKVLLAGPLVLELSEDHAGQEGPYYGREASI